MDQSVALRQNLFLQYLTIIAHIYLYTMQYSHKLFWQQNSKAKSVQTILLIPKEASEEGLNSRGVRKRFLWIRFGTPKNAVFGSVFENRTAI